MAAVPEQLAAALADRYSLERELGAGGMATVYLAPRFKAGLQRIQARIWERARRDRARGVL